MIERKTKSEIEAERIGDSNIQEVSQSCGYEIIICLKIISFF